MPIHRCFGALLIGLSLLTFVAGCASSPELAKYPRDEINRPYTLPKGVATWSTPIPFGVIGNDSQWYFSPPIPIPFYWQSSLSDSWTLNWSPLPLSVSHQIFRDNFNLVGLSFGIGMGYASGNVGFAIDPGIDLFYRRKINTDWAWEVGGGSDFWFFTGGYGSSWDARLRTGPLWQISKTFAARAKVILDLTNGTPELFNSADVVPLKEVRLTLPLSLSTTWSIARQWDLDLSYTYKGIGYRNGYFEHLGNVTFVHYW